MPKTKNTTVGDLLKSLKRRLQAAGIDSPDINAEQILGKAANLDRSEIFLNMDLELALNEVRKSEKLLKRRLKGEPLQYILGSTEFYGLPFNVDERVLIPRPETECLVDWSLEVMAEYENPMVLDIGTGSGAISIAIASNHPGADIVAFDKSLNALKLAAGNSRLNDVREQIQFVVGDLFREDFINSVGNEFDIVVCNPPYISEAEMEDLDIEIREYEPAEALTDHADGLLFFRRLVKVIPTLCAHKGWVLVETAAERAVDAMEILRKALPNVSLRKDLAGNPRIIGGRYIQVKDKDSK